MVKPHHDDLQQKLQSYLKQYRELKERILDVGFICSGSFVERRVTCGNPQCPCRSDPDKLHGPYCQLSWKVKGKSVSRFLSSEEAALYREWISNRQKLAAIVDAMYDISEKARDCLLPTKAAKKRQPDRVRRASRPRRAGQNGH